MSTLDRYDICVLSVKADEPIARRLGESIRSYRLPANVRLPDGASDYRRILYDMKRSYASAHWNLATDNHVLFQAFQMVDATRNRRRD